MKKFLILLLLASPAFGATWSVTLSASQDARFDRQRAKANKATCNAYGLPDSCTQTQARNAFCAQPGSSGPHPCTVNGVASSTVVVYSDAGDYLDRFVAGEYLRMLKAQHDREDQEAFENAWWGTSQANRNAACVAIGLPAGCR